MSQLFLTRVFVVVFAFAVLQAKYATSNGSEWVRVDEGSDNGAFIRKRVNVDLIDELPPWVQAKIAISAVPLTVLDWARFDDGLFLLISKGAHRNVVWRIEPLKDYYLDIESPVAIFTDGERLGVVSSAGPESESGIMQITKGSNQIYRGDKLVASSHDGMLDAAFLDEGSKIAILYAGYIEIRRTDGVALQTIVDPERILNTVNYIAVDDNGGLIVAGFGGAYLLNRQNAYSKLELINIEE